MKRLEGKAKKKATEIAKRFWMSNPSGQDSYKTAVDNAKIAVDEIIQAITPFAEFESQYWEMVKQELNNL